MKKWSFVLGVGCVFLLNGLFTSSFAQNEQDYLREANTFYKRYEYSKNKEDLEKAFLCFYKSAQVSPTLESYLGMGKIFVEKNMHANAKKYLYRALSIDKNDGFTNYYLAILAYLNEEYVKALDLFKIAYQNGLADNYDVNLKLATIYEKVGDFELAKTFYSTAMAIDANDSNSKNNLKNIDELELTKNKYFENLN